MSTEHVVKVTVGPKTPDHIFYGQGSKNAFIIDGIDSPQLNPIPGDTYVFIVDTPTHPFYITTDRDGGAGFPGSLMELGADPESNEIPEPTDQGIIKYVFPEDFPRQAYFQCGAHKKMGGPINIQEKPKDQTLYERLGGIFPIAMVVNHFSDALVKNIVAGEASDNPFLKDWYANHLDRLPGLKFLRTLWLASISGGPFVYTPVRAGKCPFSLENAHAKFQISPEEFDAVAEELTRSLDHYKISRQDKEEVLAAFAAHKDEVTFGYDVANGLPTGEINC